MSEASLRPSDAIKLLYRAIALGNVRIVPSYVAQDLASVRRARSNDAEFAAAVLAIAREIHAAQKSPARFGLPIEHDLDGWRRSKFSSTKRKTADLRLIFRPAKPSGIEILAFGDREFPQSVLLHGQDSARADLTARGPHAGASARCAPYDLGSKYQAGRVAGKLTSVKV